jgi:hypothetical protein
VRKLSGWLAAVASLSWGLVPLFGGTYASFSDLASATGNIVGGTINLLLSDQDEPFKDNLETHTWVLTSALPADPAVCESFQLTNAGTAQSATVNVKIVNTGTGGSAMAQEITFDSFAIGFTNLLPLIDGNLDGHPGISVRDLELDADGFTVPRTLFANQGNSTSIGGCLSFHGDAPNGLQGQTWLGTFHITISS